MSHFNVSWLVVVVLCGCHAGPPGELTPRCKAMREKPTAVDEGQMKICGPAHKRPPGLRAAAPFEMCGTYQGRDERPQRRLAREPHLDRQLLGQPPVEEEEYGYGYEFADEPLDFDAELTKRMRASCPDVCCYVRPPYEQFGPNDATW